MGRAFGDLKAAIMIAMGEVTMCWSETPRGEFDSVRAVEIAEELVQKITDSYNLVPIGEMPKIDPDTAITAFVGWMTSRDEVSGPFSSQHEAADAVELVKKFCEAQGWNSSLTRFHQQIKLLKEKYP